jgi:undecaprenyl-diphosphatase
VLVPDRYRGGIVDWSIFHALNGALRRHDGGQDAAQLFNAWAIFALVGLAGAVWFVARPGGSQRSKLAALSAAASAALALLLNVLLGQLWFHDRPFVDHPRATLLLVQHGADNSFPSDHASVAFAIAFAVLAFHRRFGLVLLLGAAAVAIDRIFVGVHYPVDVTASVFVGLVSALAVTTVGRPYVSWGVRQLSRLSDPVVAGARGRIGLGRRP